MRHSFKPRVRKRSVDGGVLVEAIMAISALVVACGGLVFMHRYAAGNVQAFMDARRDAWAAAMTQCDQGESLAGQIAADIVRLDLPTPDGLIPVPARGQGAYQVPGMMGKGQESGTREVIFVCNPKPSLADPIAQPGDWVINMFDEIRNPQP